MSFFFREVSDARWAVCINELRNVCSVRTRTRQRNKFLASMGIEPNISGFDRSLLYRLSYKARREQVVSEKDGSVMGDKFTP